MHYLFATGLFLSTSSSLINLEYCKKKRMNESQHFSKFVYIRRILFIIFDIPIYESSIDIKYTIWNIKYKIFAICNKWKCDYYHNNNYWISCCLPCSETKWYCWAAFLDHLLSMRTFLCGSSEIICNECFVNGFMYWVEVLCWTFPLQKS